MQKITDAIDFALTNGLIKYDASFKLTHAPFCLSPFGLTKEQVTSMEQLTPVFNELMMNVGQDNQFLKEHLSDAAGTDSFVRGLLDLHERVAFSHHLQISRNDFLMSLDQNGVLHPRQVEFNSIANSFIYLSRQVNLLHQHLTRELICEGNLSPNNPLDEMVDALGEIFDYYGVDDAHLLMVVQPKEQNLFDQRGIEYRLLESRGIRTLRMTLEEVAENGVLRDGHLILNDRTIALVYFRAGYTPNDYPGESAWKGRELIETSSAVKCPSVGMQLAGAKKIQQVLAKPGMVEQFISPQDAARVRETFVGMYELDETIDEKPLYQVASESPGQYVLKPQREGGGNNFYDNEMVSRLKSMSEQERKAYILMERIQSPAERSILVVDRVAEETDTVSEVGRYAACFHDGEKIRFNRDIGYLVRTKAADQNEGGVCAGYACLNSLCLS